MASSNPFEPMGALPAGTHFAGTTPHEGYKFAFSRDIAEYSTRDRKALPQARPVTFEGCFGWLHDVAEGMGSDTAVLLCAGLATDKLSGHRGFLQLGERLSSIGYPTLRFDYPDAGDSRDSGDTERWALWLASIGAAIAWLRAQVGVHRFVLIGLRIGATLAALAAQKSDDVVALILLEPVLRGQSFVRQLSIEQQLSRVQDLSPHRGIDLHELTLSAETVKRISQVDLRELRLPQGCRVAVFSRSHGPVLSAAVACWRASGVQVAVEDFAGLEPFTRPTFMNHEGPPDTTRLLTWIRGAVRAQRHLRDRPPALEYIALSDDGWIETPLLFGPGRRLFGMLCSPRGNVARKVAVVLVNTAGDPHYGFGRFSVAFARNLAAVGIASLRMDCAGLGDTFDPPGGDSAPSHIMETDRRADIAASLDALEALGYTSFALHGLCTGAYHAMQAALSDRRVNALLLVNLPMFSWRWGDPVEAIGVFAPTNYLERLGSPRKLIQLLRGRRFDISRALYSVRQALRDRMNRVIHVVVKPFQTSRDDRPGHTAMRELSRQNVRTLLLYASHDAGIQAFTREFGALGVDLPGVDVRVLSGLDHSLSRSFMRRVVVDHMIQYLTTPSDA